MTSREDFVVLYDPVDSAWAEWCIWQLEQGWYTVTRRPWHAGDGALTAVLARAEEQADRLLVLFSESLLGSLRRLDAAGALTADRARMVPVIVRPCAFPDGRAPADPIALPGLDEESARAALLAGARAGRPTEKPEPTRFDEALRQSTRRPTFPADRAPVFRTLAPRAESFAGRASELAAIPAALARGPVALVPADPPAPGTGLTALAREVAWRAGNRYGVVWWVRAYAPHAIEADLAALAHPLGLPERTRTDIGSVLAAVAAWLANHDGWLLILDDAPGPEALPPYLRAHPGGHLLVTSAAPGWPEPWSVVRVERRPSAPESPSIFESMSEETIRRAFAELERWSPAAAELLEIAAWLSAEDIPLKLLETAAPYLTPALAAATADHEAFHDAIHATASSGLAVEEDETTLHTHAEVQRVLRARLAPAKRAATARAASALVCYAGSFFFHDGRSWAAHARWAPHAHAVIDRVAGAGLATRQTLELARSLSDAHATQGRNDMAIAVARTALALAQQLEPVPGREVSRCLSELAWRYGRAGDRAAQRALLIESLTLAERSGAGANEVADRLTELAAVDEASGEPANAEAQLVKAAELLAGQPDGVTVLRRLGTLRAGRGDMAGAREAWEAARGLEDLFGGSTTDLDELIATLPANRL